MLNIVKTENLKNYYLVLKNICNLKILKIVQREIG